MSATFVLVHGAWHGAWCWDPVVAALGDSRVVTLDLPSNHVEGAGFTDDVRAVRDLLDAAGGDVVLCGHSYGGAVISEAGAHDAVAHLVYLAAFVLDVGESVSSNAAPAMPAELQAAMRVDGDRVSIDPGAAPTVFYGDVADPPVDRLVPHNLRAFIVKCTAAAWKDRPSTYVLCREDGAAGPWQRFFADRCSSVVELDASHSPMLSMPDRVADILRAAAT